jgi:aldose 1-epimerase
MEISYFGRTPYGDEVHKIVIENEFLRCALISYGAAVVSLEAPDREGRPVDVALGFDSLGDYMAQTMFMGATIGRVANRIGGSGFCLAGREYSLSANEGPNHLHGGTDGFDKRVWAFCETPGGVRFSLTSPDMDQGYPGRLNVEVDYVLDGAALVIGYRASSDADTMCSLTNHTYFNLSGHDSGSIYSHELRLFSQSYTPVADSASIPTGEIASVVGTPMDFRTPKEIGRDIDSEFDQLRLTSGYDHNWVVDGPIGVSRPAARAYSPETGIVMDVLTTSPGIQVYSGNYIGGPAGKHGTAYENRGGFCLETQFFPDAPNKPGFPSCLLRAGEFWEHKTCFVFDTQA